MDEHFIYIVLEIVSEIPKGNVATYKQLAKLAGRERNARQVGKILSASSCMANTRAIASLTVPEGLHRIGMNRKIYS